MITRNLIYHVVEVTSSTKLLTVVQYIPGASPGKPHTYELNYDLVYNIYHGKSYFIPKLCADKRFFFVGDDWKKQLGCERFLCKKAIRSRVDWLQNTTTL